MPRFSSKLCHKWGSWEDLDRLDVIYALVPLQLKKADNLERVASPTKLAWCRHPGRPDHLTNLWTQERWSGTGNEKGCRVWFVGTSNCCRYRWSGQSVRSDICLVVQPFASFLLTRCNSTRPRRLFPWITSSYCLLSGFQVLAVSQSAINLWQNGGVIMGGRDPF